MCGMRRDFIFEAADESRAKRDKKNMYLKYIVSLVVKSFCLYTNGKSCGGLTLFTSKLPGPDFPVTIRLFLFLIIELAYLCWITS